MFSDLLAAAAETLSASELDEVRHFVGVNEMPLALETMVDTYVEEHKLPPPSVTASMDGSTAIGSSSSAPFSYTWNGGDLPSIVPQLSSVDGISSSMKAAEITVLRDGASGKQAFFVHLLRGEDGIWRIESM